MAKVKIKVSGCFRIQLRAKARRRASSYPISMAALGYNPLVAIRIALAGDAAASGADRTGDSVKRYEINEKSAAAGPEQLQPAKKSASPRMPLLYHIRFCGLRRS